MKHTDEAQAKAEEFDHPCKQTCSGWQQGFEKGQASMRAEARLEGAYIEQQMACAKRALDNGDPGFAAFCLRDLEISKDLGIDGLFACLASENGFPHENDVKPLIERIVKALKGAGGST